MRSKVALASEEVAVSSIITAPDIQGTDFRLSNYNLKSKDWYLRFWFTIWTQLRNIIIRLVETGQWQMGFLITCSTWICRNEQPFTYIVGGFIRQNKINNYVLFHSFGSVTFPTSKTGLLHATLATCGSVWYLFFCICMINHQFSKVNNSTNRAMFIHFP